MLPSVSPPGHTPMGGVRPRTLGPPSYGSSMRCLAIVTTPLPQGSSTPADHHGAHLATNLPGMDRRGFLAAVVATALAGACSSGEGDQEGTAPTTAGNGESTTTGPAASLPVPDLPGDPFTLGVGSGDPLPTAIVLWTRLAPEPLSGGGMPDVEVPVTWELATDDTFGDLVASGTAVATPALGHSVHVDATDLEADTWYAYRFRVGDHTSPTGRTRTAPAIDADVARWRFAVASCQAYQDGYWTAYPHLVDEPDLDLVVFLGDYIYESGINEEAVRQHNSDEVITLEDYRNRYGLYRSDENLRAAHAACPWVVVWDDHEVDNNYAGLVPEDGAPVGPDAFAERRAAAYLAWYEHQAVRLDPPEGADLMIHRSFRWGGLAELFALDSRQYRSDQACGDATLDMEPACEESLDPERTMLGTEQEGWLIDGLSASPCAWKVLANQVVLGDVRLGEAVINYDQWDGYPAARQRLLDAVVANDVTGLVVVTGDIHFSAAGDLRIDQADPAAPIIASEFVGTSMGSAMAPNLVEAIAGFADLFPDVHYSNAALRGYMLCTVTPELWTTDYRTVETTITPTSPIDTDASFVIEAGTPGMQPG